jgi:hypothetical protein
MFGKQVEQLISTALDNLAVSRLRLWELSQPKETALSGQKLELVNNVALDVLCTQEISARSDIVRLLQLIPNSRRHRLLRNLVGRIPSFDANAKTTLVLQLLRAAHSQSSN